MSDAGSDSSSSSSSSSDSANQIALLNERLNTSIANGAKYLKEVDELKDENRRLKEEMRLKDTEVVEAGKTASKHLKDYENAQRQLDSISQNLQRGWTGKMPRGGFEKFLTAKGATEKVRTMCIMHIGKLAFKWWKHMKLLPNNWHEFSTEKNSIPGKMMYDLRKSRSGEMTMIVEWYWWIQPLTAFIMKGYRNQKTVVAHGGWKGEQGREKLSRNVFC